MRGRRGESSWREMEMREGGGFGGLVMGMGRAGFFWRYMNEIRWGWCWLDASCSSRSLGFSRDAGIIPIQANPVRTNERTNIIFRGLTYICSRSGTS